MNILKQCRFLLGFENEIDWVRTRLNRLINERETSDEGMRLSIMNASFDEMV